jgi:hypothetical protein
MLKRKKKKNVYTLYKAYKITSTPKTDVIINLYITDPYTELNHL